MRRANQEIKDRDEIIAVLKDSDACRIGMYAGGEVYIVPMSFGFDFSDDGELTLYFHCAAEGRKLDAIAENPLVGFEMDTGRSLVPGQDNKACTYTMNYSSIIGNGRIEVLNDREEKISALKLIMKQYSDEENFEFDNEVLKRTTVLRLAVSSYTGKRLQK